MPILKYAQRWLPLGAAALYLIVTGNALADTALPGFVEATFVRHQGRELSQSERDIANALDQKADQPLAADPVFNLKYETDAIGSDLGYREWEGGVELPLWSPGQSREYKREAERTGRYLYLLYLTYAIETERLARVAELMSTQKRHQLICETLTVTNERKTGLNGELFLSSAP